VEQRAVTWRRWVVAAFVLAFVGGGSWLALTLVRASPMGRPAARIPRVVPESTRVKVEVLNATDTHGLARRAMFVLRDAGFDVVYFGNTAERSDSTVVRDRSGHAAWAALAAKAMHGARIEESADSSHFLDLTILVGRNWTPAREPLYP
jgi:hypothetical protein